MEYQTVAQNGLPTPMTQPDLTSSSPVDPFFSLDQLAISYQQSVITPQPYVSAALSNETTFHPCVPYNIQSNLPYAMDQLSGEFPSTLSATPYDTQTWAESLSAFPVYTAPPTPEYPHIQNQGADNIENTTSFPEPTLNKSRSKELVGMGLYDAPDRSSFSSFTSGPLSHPGHESMGKGLKLEETWQPPEDEEDDDEGEEEEEQAYESAAPLPVEEPRRTEMVQGFGTMWGDNTYMDGALGKTMGGQGMGMGYGDLSNQSFFFDGDGDFYEGGEAGPQVILKDYMWA